MTISEEFSNWYNSVHDSVAIKNKHWSTFQINRFVKNTHRFLKLYGMCFLSGAYVFEDIDSLLFNLLTYGKFEKVMPNATRRVPNPTTDFLKEDTDELASAHVSGTHNVFLKHNQNKQTPHHTYSKSTAKFERLFHKKFRKEPFEYLCDLCVESPDIKNKEEKRVILYYPFLTKDTNQQMLYVKYESYPMNAREHAFEFLGNAAQSRANEYPKRRENGKNYDTELKQKDLNFYRTTFPEDLSSLEKYNETYREGDEFFIGNNLLKYLLMNFLSYSDTPICEINVKKRTTRNIVNSDTSLAETYSTNTHNLENINKHQRRKKSIDFGDNISPSSSPSPSKSTKRYFTKLFTRKGGKKTRKYKRKKILKK